MHFFQTSTRNLLAAAAEGVGLHVALSVVGTERLTESGYFRAKIAQEGLIDQLASAALDRCAQSLGLVRDKIALRVSHHAT
jgi:uncharacterized protein YbjT (DUF2867 family)